MTGPEPLARLTLLFDPAHPEGIHLDLDIGEPADGVTGEDLAQTMVASARLIAWSVNQAWDRLRAERN
jgi:hypothetical protein